MYAIPVMKSPEITILGYSAFSSHLPAIKPVIKYANVGIP